MKAHWTARGVSDYLFRIAADFIVQLENKMESLNISQDELAQKLGVTKGRVSQLINHPGNFRLGKMIEYARALGLKVSIVAYEDNDPENKKGPIDSEIFRICWERSGKPHDFWDAQNIVDTKITAATYSPVSQSLFTAGNVADVKLLYGWVAACQGYLQVGKFAGNQSPDILKRDEVLPS